MLAVNSQLDEEDERVGLGILLLPSSANEEEAMALSTSGVLARVLCRRMFHFEFTAGVVELNL